LQEKYLRREADNPFTAVFCTVSNGMAIGAKKCSILGHNCQSPFDVERPFVDVTPPLTARDSPARRTEPPIFEFFPDWRHPTGTLEHFVFLSGLWLVS
jgi:hypothetical protein